MLPRCAAPACQSDAPTGALTNLRSCGCLPSSLPHGCYGWWGVGHAMICLVGCLTGAGPGASCWHAVAAQRGRATPPSGAPTGGRCCCHAALIPSVVLLVEMGGGTGCGLLGPRPGASCWHAVLPKRGRTTPPPGGSSTSTPGPCLPCPAVTTLFRRVWCRIASDQHHRLPRAAGSGGVVLARCASQGAARQHDAPLRPSLPPHTPRNEIHLASAPHLLALRQAALCPGPGLPLSPRHPTTDGHCCRCRRRLVLQLPAPSASFKAVLYTLMSLSRALTGAVAPSSAGRQSWPPGYAAAHPRAAANASREVAKRVGIAVPRRTTPACPWAPPLRPPAPAAAVCRCQPRQYGAKWLLRRPARHLPAAPPAPCSHLVQAAARRMGYALRNSCCTLPPSCPAALVCSCISWVEG